MSSKDSIRVISSYKELEGIGMDYDLAIFESDDVLPLFSSPSVIDPNIIAIIKSGWVKLNYGMEELTVRKNEMIVFLSDSQITITDHSPDFKSTAIVLSRKFATAQSQCKSLNLRVRFLQKPIVPLTVKEFNIAYPFFNQIRYIAESKMENKGEVAAKIFDVMFHVFMNFEAIRKQPEIAQTRKEQVVEKFITLAMRHHREAREVIWYADKLCMTSSYLASIVKHATGKSANTWINQFVISDSKRILRKNKGVSILDVSEQLGFPDQAVFCKFFKKHVGCTPSTYREM